MRDVDTDLPSLSFSFSIALDAPFVGVGGYNFGSRQGRRQLGWKEGRANISRASSAWNHDSSALHASPEPPSGAGREGRVLQPG